MGKYWESLLAMIFFCPFGCCYFPVSGFVRGFFFFFCAVLGWDCWRGVWEGGRLDSFIQ